MVKDELLSNFARRMALVSSLAQNMSRSTVSEKLANPGVNAALGKLAYLFVPFFWKKNSMSFVSFVLFNTELTVLGFGC